MFQIVASALPVSASAVTNRQLVWFQDHKRPCDLIDCYRCRPSFDTVSRTYFAVHRSVLRNTLHNCRRCTCIRPYFPSKSGDEPCISALNVVGCVKRQPIYHCTCQNMENACLQQLGHPDTGDNIAHCSLQYCVCHLDCAPQRFVGGRAYLLSPILIVENVTKKYDCCRHSYQAEGLAHNAASSTTLLPGHQP